MARKRIQGITIELDGETKGLDKALKNVNDRSVQLQKELRDVDRLLKFDPGNVEALAQKQQLLTKQIENTTERLDQLRSAQQQVEQQFERGEIGEEQYRSFRREIEFTEGTLAKLRNQLQYVEQEQENIQKSTQRLERLFEATGKSADDFSDVLGIKLTNAIKDGRASSRQLETAIDKIGKEALGANADLDKMRQALDQMDDGKSLDAVRKDLDNVVREAGEAEQSIKDVGAEIENVIGGLVAGGGIAGAVEQALDVSSLETKIDISFDVPPESVAAVRDAINTATAYIEDQEAAIEGVRRQWALNADASDEANARIVQGAATISAAYAGIDFTELIQEINEIASALKISDEEALALTNSLLKAGFPPEQLDIISEYGLQLQNAGYEAEEIQAIFAAGIETETWNIDNLLDGLKEGRIRLAEFGQEVPESIRELLEGTDISAKQLQEWGQAVAEGGETGKQAMREVAEAVNEIDDETTKSQLGVAIWGTMYEDQGQLVIDTILGAKDQVVDLRENQEQLNESVSQMESDPVVQFQQAMLDLKVALTPLLTTIADIISKFAEWIQQNPQLAATIAAIVSVVGILFGLFLALAPIVTALSTAAAALGIGLLPLTGIIAGIIAAVAALIAIGVLLWQNWDTIRAKATEIWTSIKEWLSQTWENIKTKASEIWNNIKNSLSEAWNNIKTNTKEAWNNIKNSLSETWDNIKTTVREAATNAWNTIKNKFNDIKQAISDRMEDAWETIQDVWDNVMDFFEGIDLFEIGKDIIQGLIDGIKNMAGNLAGAVGDVVDDAVQWAKDKLGIASPSKVFQEIGEDTGEGFIRGINSMMRDVRQATTAMAEVAIPRTPNHNQSTLQPSTQSDNRVIALLQDIANGIRAGQVIVMDERVVGRIIEPHVTETQERNRVRRERFAT